MSLKIGQTIKFLFHGFGVVSHEEAEIIKIEDNVITISQGEPNYKFSLSTGICLNDNTHMDCSRTLPDKYLNKKGTQ